MIRILFVDDEEAVLEGLRDALRRFRDEWEMRFALGGRAALAELEAGAFDVVVSDMRMPDVDGAAVLAEARERQPAAVRIVLSGQTELEQELRALPVAHQFLTKPCDTEELHGVVARACSVRELLDRTEIRSIVGAASALPSPPAAYAELTAALSSPDASVADVVAIVERDVAMSAKVIQLVNSAFFGLGRRTADAREAIAYLGVETVRAATLLGGVMLEFRPARPVAGFSLDALERHSLRVVGHATQVVRRADVEHVLMGAMLHDVGKLLLASHRPDELAASIAEAGRRGCPPHVVELELLGTTHAEIGASLLAFWGLPDPVVETVAHHHRPERSPRGAPGPAVVHVVDALVTRGERPDAPWAPALLDRGGLAAAGWAERALEWEAAVAERLREEAAA
ncbi:MAG: response regulator [Thermoleophilia bacterium]